MWSLLWLGTCMKKECWDHEGIPKSLKIEWPDLKCETQQNDIMRNSTKWDESLQWHQMKWQNEVTKWNDNKMKWHQNEMTAK